MINLTVKTLDSRNHEFSVEDNITVAQFKEKIADQIDIPADTQRIIYCGRVLKDELKLNHYDVNGKVVHLVQRAPPTSTQSSARPTSPQPTRRGPHFVRNAHENIYLGSMHIPATLMETAAPPPTHSLAASRLNVAKRMLRRTENVLNQLENPSARSGQTPPEEQQEEVTPVFEARVIVPNSAFNEPLDEAFVLSAVQNTIFDNASSAAGSGMDNSSDAAATSNGSDEAAGTSGSTSDENEPTRVQSESSSPEGTTPTTSTPNASTSGSEQRAQNGNGLSDNVSPTTEMADLLDQLGRIQIRLAPFLEQYQNFMRQDPAVPQEDSRKTQVLLNRVSEILHFLGHAYHSLSDIIVRARTPPPRPLLCRPILIQHSAVVQTGIPIQVEAEINFNAEIPSATSTPVQTSQASSTTSSSNGQQSATTTPSEGAQPADAAQSHTTHLRGQPQVFRFPIGAGITVESVPIPFNLANLHNLAPRMNQQPESTPQPNATGAPASGSTEANIPNEVPSMDTTAEGTTDAAPAGSSASANANQQRQFTMRSGMPGLPTMFQNNPNVEFIMEVTPESITIDSSEPIPGVNRDVLRGMTEPPPDFIQSIMQMASQMMTRPHLTIHTAHGGNQPQQQQPSAPPAENAATSTATSTQTTQVNAQSSQQTGQNSQARGNTSTNPTTSTHTRTSSRPHVHLAQHAMQGFDPFLPCNSHHVTNRRRATAVRTSGPYHVNQNGNNRAGAQNPLGMPQGLNQQFNPLYNLVRGIMNTFQNVVRQRTTPAGTPTSSATPPTNASAPNTANGDGNIPGPMPGGPFINFLPHLQSMNLSDVGAQGPTIADLLQQIPDDNYVEGESIFNDLITFLARNLTLGDMMQLKSGRLEPLMRIRREIRNFFLFRVLNGVPNAVNTDRGVTRLLSEMQPFLQNLDRLNVRDDIDIVRSSQMLFRARLPNIISLAVSHSPNSLRMLVEQCKITIRQLAALVLNASNNGQPGVEDVVEYIVSRYMHTGTPEDIQQWYLMASREFLRHLISNLSVPESILQPYIVRRVDSITNPVAENASCDETTENVGEPMDLDDQEPSGSTESDSPPLPSLNLADDPEPLPSVVLGSEGWHSQVPADWVPLIARDSQRQRRQNQQPAFSDAYLSGMPSKRRKIVTSAKPQGSLPQVITESVRRAVTASGLVNVTNLDSVSQAAGSDINIQSAYRDLLRSSVQTNLQDNADFTPDRFPNATNYFNKPQ